MLPGVEGAVSQSSRRRAYNSTIQKICQEAQMLQVLGNWRTSLLKKFHQALGNLLIGERTGVSVKRNVILFRAGVMVRQQVFNLNHPDLLGAELGEHLGISSFISRPPGPQQHVEFAAVPLVENIRGLLHDANI